MTYTVVRGDTLSKIAVRFGVSVAQLLEWNPEITDPGLIRVGQVIRVSAPEEEKDYYTKAEMSHIIAEIHQAILDNTLRISALELPPPDPGVISLNRAIIQVLASELQPDAEPATPPSVYGAVDYGPEHETATTTGTQATTSNYSSVISAASSGQTVLLRAGSYGSFSIPAGVTVKPYNGESVTVTGSISMGNGSTVAGLTLVATGSWGIRLNRDNASPHSNHVIRHMHISGAGIENIRVSRNIQNFLIDSCHIVNSGTHGIKTHGEGSAYVPSGTIRNTLVEDAGEDGIQTEPGNVLIENCTFDGAAEDSLDLKGGTITVTKCKFLSASQGAILTHQTANSIIDDNEFVGNNVVACGSNNALTGGVGAGMVFKNNSQSPCNLLIRRSIKPVVIEDDILSGGSIRLGTSATGDFPADVTIRGCVLTNVDLTNPHNVDYTYEDNSRTGGSGW